MPRPLSYAWPASERFARNGAESLDRIEGEMVDERRYQDRVGRQDANDARAMESHDLDMDVRKYHHAKEKAFDENEALLKRDLVLEATEANQVLRDIRTDAPDAVQQLSDWRVKHFRLLDPKLGDQRLINQLDINQRFVNQLQIERERDARERQVRVEKQQAAREKAGAGKTAPKGEGKDKEPTAKPVEQAVAPVGDEEAPGTGKPPGGEPDGSLPTATNPQTGEKVIWKDGKWQSQ